MAHKILFLGETYRADAITWMKGLKEFGDFEIISWELKTPNNSVTNRIFRLLEFAFCVFSIRKIVKCEKPAIVIAERATSYGFLAALSGAKIIIIAQQGISDLWPEKSILYPLKKIIQNYAFKKATLIHAWGQVMLPAMIDAKVAPQKIMLLPKGIDLKLFNCTNIKSAVKITAVVTRSLQPEYGHLIILKAFEIIKKNGFEFELTIVGDGKCKNSLKQLAKDLDIIENVHFLGKVKNADLPAILQKNQFYISMPITEGVSASLFEAMACKCYPIVSDIAGNRIFIDNYKNGILIPPENELDLANAIIFAHENQQQVKIAINKNHDFVQKNANYKTNMTMIAKKYHEIIIQKSK